MRGRYLDDLAIQRSALEENWKHRIAIKEQAILHHRDSQVAKTLTVSQIEELANSMTARSSSKDLADMRSYSSRGPKPTRGQVANPSIQLLRKIGIFSNCSDEFLGLIASSSEHLHLKAGDVREMEGARVGVAQVSPAVAIIVESGNFRIEIAHTVVDECIPGSCYGLANVLAKASGFAGRSSTPGAQAPIDFVVRAVGSCPEGYRILMFHSIGVRNAIQECPLDHAHLHEVLHVVNQSVHTTNLFVNLLHCCESAKASITESTTRHIFTQGEYICHENQRSPDGLVLIRSGVVALEISDVEVRRISKGQSIGEEILSGVSRKWGVTARCTTLCDVVILHRRLFTDAAKKMAHGSTEDMRESERLLLFLEGHWRDDKLILSWPLFRGFDADLLTSLAHLIETRVLLPSTKLWEGGGSHSHHVAEVALYVLLSGACEETMTTEQKRPGHAGATETRSVRRPLVPGTCIGTREFLGLRSLVHLVVKARSLCIVAVLHRAVFLKAIENHPVETPQASEITKILKEELDKEDADKRELEKKELDKKDNSNPASCLKITKKNIDSPTSFVGSLPIFKTHDKRFIERLCSHACKRRYCIAGQSICCPDTPASNMYVFVRGKTSLTIAGLHIKDYTSGEPINMLALAEEEFQPSYTVVCERASEFWAISRDDFASCLESVPFEKAKFNDLLHAPADLEIIVKTRVFEKRYNPDDDHPNDHGNGRMTPQSGAGTPSMGSTLALTDLSIFRACSPEFISWITNHLQAAIYFPDEVIIPLSQEDSSLYIIRHGSIISEGIDTNQERLDIGHTIGDHRLLNIAQTSQTSNQALDVTVVQILHQCVFKKALELFPDQVPHFDKLILAQMDGVAGYDIKESSPFFHTCSTDFCKQIARITKTRLVHPGSLLLEEGSEQKVLRIMKSGVAIVDDDGDDFNKDFAQGGALHGIKVFNKKREPTRLTNGVVLNTDVVLGTAHCVKATVRAERLCAVGEIEGPAFLSILQRFPEEIKSLIHSAAGAPWPTICESVPLFAGINNHFFNQLMERADWIMCLPDQCVVKQGGRGDLLFLLCYGAAIAEVDGIVIGSELGRGDCIGKTNFFGLTTRYSATVRTRPVCHFRAIPGSVREQLLQEHVAERERFETLKLKVQAEASELELHVKEQATREKLRRREDLAFRGHIARERDNRGLTPFGSSLSIASLQESTRLEEESQNQDGTSFQDLVKRNTLAPLSHRESASSIASRAAHATQRQSAASHHSRHSQASNLSSHREARARLLKQGSIQSSGFSLVARMRSLHKSTSMRSSASSKKGSLFRQMSRGSSKASRLSVLSRKSQMKKGGKEDDTGSQDGNGVTDMEQGDGQPERPASGGDDSESSSSSSDSVPNTKVERIVSAITQHTGERQRAITKGRLLRMLRSGMAPAGPGALSTEDLALLNYHLPKVPKPDSASSCDLAGLDTRCHRIQERNVQISAGRSPMQDPSPAAEQALRRKYRQLSSQQLGAIVPGQHSFRSEESASSFGRL